MRGVGPKGTSSYFRKLRRQRARLGVQECRSSTGGTVAVRWNPTHRALEGGDFPARMEGHPIPCPLAPWRSLPLGSSCGNFSEAVWPGPMTTMTQSCSRKGSTEGLILAISTVKAAPNIIMSVWICLYICKYTSMQIFVSIYPPLCVHLPKWCQ